MRARLGFRQLRACAVSPGISRLKTAPSLALPDSPFSPRTPVEQPRMINYPNTSVDHCCFDTPLVLMSRQAAELLDDLLLPKCSIQIPEIALFTPMLAASCTNTFSSKRKPAPFFLDLLHVQNGT